MAASGSEMEVVLVAQVGQYVKSMQDVMAANSAMAKTIKDFTGGMAGVATATKPAEVAVQGLSKSFVDFKRDQVQQGRLVGFYVREVGQFVDVSRGAQSAIGGLGGALFEMASGAGPLALAFAGMELVKGVIGLIREESAKAAAEMKKFVDETARVVDAGAKAASTLAGREKSRATKLAGGDPEFDAARQEAISAARALQEFKARFGLRGKDSTSNLQGLSISADQIILWSQLEAKVREATAALKAYQTLKPQNDKAEAEKKTVEGRHKEVASALDLMIADITAKNRKIIELLSKPVAAESFSKDNGVGLLGGDFTQKRAEMKLAEPVIDTNFFAKGQDKALEPMKAMNAELQNMIEVGSVLGDTVGGAFAAIGSAIGGTAGKFVASVGEMITQAIKFAIAMVTASAAEVPVVGWLIAAGAGVSLLASLVGTLSSVPSYDVGTLSVPKTELAMVHRGEAILPADGTAQAYRSGGRSVNANFTINAMDGASVYRVITDNRGPVARALREMARDS